MLLLELERIGLGQPVAVDLEELVDLGVEACGAPGTLHDPEDPDGQQPGDDAEGGEPRMT